MHLLSTLSRLTDASSEASFKGNFIGDGDGDNHSIISRSTGVGATYDLLVRTANPVRPASRMSQCSVSTIRETLPPPCIKPSTTYHNNISNNINAENTLRALQTSWVEQTKLLSNDQAKLLQNKTPEIPRIKLDFMPETPLPKALKDPNSGGTKRSNRSVSFDSESIAKGTKGQMQETTESTDKKQPEMTEAEDSGNKTNTILRRPQKTESIPSTKEVPNGYYGNKGIPPCILPTKLPLMSDSLYYPLNSEVSNDSHLQSDIFTANWNILLSLSVLEILLGIILATLGICRLLLLSRWGIGVELVYGVYVAVAGGLGVLGNCRKDFCLISASFVMNVLSCILALPPFILGNNYIKPKAQ